jgi:hypothetical protein
MESIRITDALSRLRSPQSSRGEPAQKHGATMFDTVLIVAGIAFFAVAILYEFACERL